MIQLSESTFNHLRKNPDYRLEPRGHVQVGHKMFKTFWLNSKRNFDPIVKIISDTIIAETKDFEYGEI